MDLTNGSSKLIERMKEFGIGSYEVCKDFDGSASSNEYYAWWYLPELIDFNRNMRNETHIFHVINISILIHSAIVIEGFLYELIKYHVGEKIYVEDFEYRLHQDFHEKLDRSSWTDLKKYYLTAIGKNLNSATNNENWKSVTNLFHFRNMLTHSKPVKFSIKVIDEKPILKHFGNYEAIYQFLLEKKLIEKVDFEKSMNTNLINSEISDFFWKESQIFINNVIESNVDFQQTPIIDSLEIAFEYKK